MTEPKQERRDHVIRLALPWRDELITECGRQVADCVTVITREQLQWRLKEHGQQRTAFTVCMTCWTTARDNSASWETHPAMMLSRELRRGHEGILHMDYGSRRWNSGGQPPPPPTGPHVDQTSAELHAIAQLIEAHREEFNQRVTQAGEAALFAHRRRRADKEAGR